MINYNNLKGKFLVVEGIKGSGKSTFAKALAEDLQSKGVDTLLTAEPTHGLIGELIRRILGGHITPKMNEPSLSEILALLFTADREAHVNGVIKPALNVGKVVICDRYVYSNMAYQGVHLGFNRMLDLNIGQPPADVVFLLKVDEHLARQRLEQRNALRGEVGINYKPDINEDAAFQKSVKDMYDNISGHFGQSLNNPIT